MPLYNEQEGIEEFIKEIVSSFVGVSISFFIVDDCSTDRSFEILTKLSDVDKKFPIDLNTRVYVKRNETNLGHGPTFVRAMEYALRNKSDLLITVDGDGQFYGEHIFAAFKHFSLGDFDVLEGVRVERSDPFYRKIVSTLTQIFVFLKCGKFPKDANTPLRIYTDATARDLLSGLPEKVLTPNLFFSTRARIMGMRIVEYPLVHIERRGSSPIGTMWTKNRFNLPSARFINFCFRAFIGLFSRIHLPK